MRKQRKKGQKKKNEEKKMKKKDESGFVSPAYAVHTSGCIPLSSRRDVYLLLLLL